MKEIQCYECQTSAISKYRCPECGYCCCEWHYDFYDGRCNHCKPPELVKIEVKK